MRKYRMHIQIETVDGEVQPRHNSTLFARKTSTETLEKHVHFSLFLNRMNVFKFFIIAAIAYLVSGKKKGEKLEMNPGQSRSYRDTFSITEESCAPSFVLFLTSTIKRH